MPRPAPPIARSNRVVRFGSVRPRPFGRLHIAPHITSFLERFPLIDLEFNLSDAFVDIAREAVDLAIRIAPRVDASLGSIRLADNRRVICAAPAYLARHGMPQSLAALTGHRLLAATGQLPWRLIGPEGPVDFDGVSDVRTNSSELVRELALSGGGIALRSLWDVDRLLADGGLVRVLPRL